MSEKSGYTPEDPSEYEDVPPIVSEVQRRLGGLGIEQYASLPRRQKKAAKKLVEGKRLTQRELARLEAIRRQAGT